MASSLGIKACLYSAFMFGHYGVWSLKRSLKTEQQEIMSTLGMKKPTPRGPSTSEIRSQKMRFGNITA